MSNNVTYGGNDFKEWWKTHFGTEYNGQELSRNGDMSDADYAVGRQLYANYQNANKINSDFQTSSNELLQNYTQGQDSLNANKRQSQQNASIAYDKLKKYLPAQIKAQGLNGLGVSESSMLQAYNGYRNDMGKIASDYSRDMTDLETAYSQNLSALEQKKNDLLYYSDKDENGNLLVHNVLEEYDSLAKEEQAALYNEESYNLETMYESMISDDSKISQADYNKLEAYAEGIRENVGETNYNLLVSQLNGYKNAVRDEQAQATIEKVTELNTPTVNGDVTVSGQLNTANDDYGDNFEISYGGTSYKVEKGYDASVELGKTLSDSYTATKGTAPPRGAVMIYGGRIYMYLENNNKNQDQWCVVQQRRTGNKNAEAFSALCEKLGLTAYGRDYKE